MVERCDIFHGDRKLAKPPLLAKFHQSPVLASFGRSGDPNRGFGMV